ncbi:MAG: PD40 domain-containing protein [Candidatus Sericytochromatia bacterium]|nr:PD40 domain-containing protein [Candidatus Sericytochromatia bacterium]
MKKIIVSLSIISPLLFAFNCTTSVPLARPSSKVSDISPSIVNYSPNNANIPNPTSSSGKVTIDQSQKIAFMSNRSGFWDIYNMNIDGSNVQKLTKDDMKTPFAFSISPDGQKIAYISDKTGNSDLWIMNLITKEVTQITDTPLGEEGSPSWSADSKRVAFHYNSNIMTNKIFKIMQINYPFIKSQSTIQTLISDVSNSLLHPSFSPDGSKILYSVNDLTKGTSYLHLYDYPTKKDIEITTRDEQPINGSWSPDSKKIIYGTVNNGIFQVNTNLTGRIAIGTFKNIKGTPFFSPDGNKITIARGYGSISDSIDDCNVWIMDNDGKNPQKITTEGGISLNWYKVSNSSSSTVITPSYPNQPTSNPSSNSGSSGGSPSNPYAVDPNDPLLNP